MNRVLVALLSVFDAALAAAGSVAIALAPLTLVFVLGFGGGADWGSLWPAAAAVWQLGHLVPQTLTLPDTYLAATGIGADAASFVLSLAPLVFTVFTAMFAARSGARAAHADAWGTGVATSSLVFTAIAAGIAFTAGSPVASSTTWQAILFPALVFALPAVAGAITVEWQEAGAGGIARLRDRIEELPGRWGEMPALAVRGAAVATVALIGLGALGVAVALLVGGGQVIALYEAAHVDVLGAVVITLGQLAYLPTLVVWSLSFLAGPGFSLGDGTAVSPSGTEVGVTPGIPILGVVPESTGPWLLLVALLPIAAGALAGWIVRSRLVAGLDAAPPPAPASDVRWATTALEGLIGPPPAAEPAHRDTDPFGVRVALAVVIAALAGAAAALLAILASGSLGPARLSAVGPQPGPVALAVGLEVLLGAGILLLAPRRRDDADADEIDEPQSEPVRASAIPFVDAIHHIPFADDHAEERTTDAVPPASADAIEHPPRDAADAAQGDAATADADETAPIEPLSLPPLRTPDPDDGPPPPAPRRPSALPPVD
jgi:hypothetical protein